MYHCYGKVKLPVAAETGGKDMDQKKLNIILFCLIIAICVICTDQGCTIADLKNDLSLYRHDVYQLRQQVKELQQKLDNTPASNKETITNPGPIIVS